MAHVIVVLTYIRNPSPRSAIGIFVTVDVYMNWKSIAYNIKWLWIALLSNAPRSSLYVCKLKIITQGTYEYVMTHNPAY